MAMQVAKQAKRQEAVADIESVATISTSINDAATSPNPEQAIAALKARSKEIHTVLGQAAWLMSQSVQHQHQFIQDIEWRLLPPIVLGQCRLFQRMGIPTAFVTWAMVNEDVASRMIGPELRLRPQDWRSGTDTWIVDVIAPKGNLPELLEALRENVFNRKSFNVRTQDPNKRTKVVRWPRERSSREQD